MNEEKERREAETCYAHTGDQTAAVTIQPDGTSQPEERNQIEEGECESYRLCQVSRFEKCVERHNELIFFVFVERYPFAPAVLHQSHAIFVPDDHAVEHEDQSCSGTCYFIIYSVFAQSPGGIDAAIGAA